LLRSAPIYTHITADNAVQDKGTFYAYDNLSRRIVAFAKADGSIVGQYMAPATSPWLTNLTGLFVVPGTNGGTPTLYWTEGGSLMSAVLAPSTGPSASASGSPGASASHSIVPSGSKKP
jgi:hypothetical protein